MGFISALQFLWLCFPRQLSSDHRERLRRFCPFGLDTLSLTEDEIERKKEKKKGKGKEGRRGKEKKEEEGEESVWHKEENEEKELKEERRKKF